MKPKALKPEVKASVRRFLLITLEHVELKGRRGVNRQVVNERVRNCFECLSVIIAEEKQQRGEKHYQVGILNTNASRYTARKVVRKAFPEWGEREIYLKMDYKGYEPVCADITHQDKQPFVWGKYELKEILTFAGRYREIYKKKVLNKKVLAAIQALPDFYQAYSDPLLATKMLDHRRLIKEVYEDLQVIKGRERNFCETLAEWEQKLKKG